MGRTIAAGIILVNKNMEILICHPTNHSWNVWSIPKGKVEEGEENIEAAIRETFEETNIDLTLALKVHPLECQKYTHGKKSLFPFMVLETENPLVNFEAFELQCNSNVPELQGGFPEMDAYEWTDFATAKERVHYTQGAAIEEIELLLKQKLN